MMSHSTGRFVGSDSDYAVNTSKVHIEGSRPTNIDEDKIYAWVSNTVSVQAPLSIHVEVDWLEIPELKT